MRVIFFAVIFLLPLAASHAQSDSVQVVSNSYKSSLNIKHPSLNYDYHTSGQIHDYSNNWDLDGDHKTDSLFFIGNNAAHVYYHLRIVLSSDNKVNDFPFLEFDFPCLGTIDELKNASFYPPPRFPQFVVHDFDSDGIHEIYLNLETKHSPIPTKWKKEGLTSRYILVRFEKRRLRLSNFIDNH